MPHPGRQSYSSFGGRSGSSKYEPMIQMYFDGPEYRSMRRSYMLAPKEIRKSINTKWGKEGKKVVKKMKPRFKSKTGPDTLGYNKKEAKREKGTRKHFWQSIRVQKKKFGSRGRFGGYIVFGTSQPGLRGQHPLLNIYENNKGTMRYAKKWRDKTLRDPRFTGVLQTESPFRKAFEAAKGEANLYKATEEGIAEGLKKAGLT